MSSCDTALACQTLLAMRRRADIVVASPQRALRVALHSCLALLELSCLGIQRHHRCHREGKIISLCEGPRGQTGSLRPAVKHFIALGSPAIPVFCPLFQKNNVESCSSLLVASWS